MARRRGRGNLMRDEDIEEALQILHESDIEEDPFGDDDIDDLDFIMQNQESSSSSEDYENDIPVVQKNRGRCRRPTKSRPQVQNARRSRGSRGRVQERSVLRPADELNASENVGDLEDPEWEDCDFDPETVPFIQPAYLHIINEHYKRFDCFSTFSFLLKTNSYLQNYLKFL
ncbi:unnamed protein product [Colias eurytheme]|nr:unnamed protein product [Colias eurytheme]